MRKRKTRESAEILLLLRRLVKSDKYVHDPDRRVAIFFFEPNSEWREYWSKVLDNESYSFTTLTYEGVGTRVGLRLLAEGVVEAVY
jgi:hypothetical protein